MGAKRSVPPAEPTGFKQKFLQRWQSFKAWGKQKVTLVFVPHGQDSTKHLQLSLFTLIAIAVSVFVIVTASVVVTISATTTAYRLSNNVAELKSGEIALNSVRGQTQMLVDVITRFKRVLSNTLTTVGVTATASPDDEVADNASGDLTSLIPGDLSTNSATSEVENIQSITNYLQNASQSIDKIGSVLANRSAVLKEIPSIWPIKNGSGYLINAYGSTEDIFTGKLTVSDGVDIATGRSGDAVVATAKGRVLSVRYNKELGNQVVIKHEHGFFTEYGHLQLVTVKEGQDLVQGKVIGFLGSTGTTITPTLHYVLRIGTGFIDPLKFLQNRANTTLVALRNDK